MRWLELASEDVVMETRNALYQVAGLGLSAAMRV
jgi:hypothetical protein